MSTHVKKKGDGVWAEEREELNIGTKNSLLSLK